MHSGTAAMRVTAVTCIKNEGPFLLEWIAHHRILGVTDFLFYSNDCRDQSDMLLDALEAAGVVRHLPNPAHGRSYQMEALKDARRHQIVTRADWIWIADIDEFLNIHAGDGSIPALIDACGRPQAISIPFQYFANDGIEEFHDRPVTGQFQRSHNPDLWCDQTAIEVKTLIRGDLPVRYYGAHRPFLKDPAQRLRWTDASGRPVPGSFARAASGHLHAIPARGARRHATLNHYALRSLDSFLIKAERGDVNRENRDFGETYWRERNDPAWRDTRIGKYRDRVEAEISALKARADIGALHDASVAWHRARIAQITQRPQIVKLRQRLSEASPFPPAEAAALEALL